jgi:pimeloyl-ACP methyl ester carboxylesterase
MLHSAAHGLKRMVQISLILCVATGLGMLFMLKPMSVNFLKYLLWKATVSAPVETGYIQNQGAHIHYEAFGTGYPVLLLHGGLSDKLSWFSQIPWLVSSGRRVVTIDTRGHGKSSHGDADLEYQAFADDAIKVLDRLGIKRTDIVGWSDGGITALLMGLESPDRVARIIAISANFHPSGLVTEMWEEKQGYQQWRNDVFNWVRGFWVAPPSVDFGELAKELQNLWQTQPQLKHSDLKAIVAPTLIIAGENDLIELSHSGELAQMLAFGKIEIILGAGHAAPVTHARQVNELIASFLGIDMI